MISCSQHDIIEIACLYRFPIKLTMRSGTEISGKAIDTRCNEPQQECIVIETDGQKKLIVLDDIEKMEACISNPHFQEVYFE